MSDSSTAPMIAHRGLSFVIFALMTGMFLAALDGTVVSTALPTIVGELHGASHLSWVVVAYLLASTVTTPVWGKLGDQFGRKMNFQASILIFLLGSVLAGQAHSMVMLIVWRGFQGLGGGGLLIGAQAIIGDLVAPKDRGRYAGAFGAVWGGATVLGPLIGGYLTEHVGWRWCFYVNIPVGVVALVVTWIALPHSVNRIKHSIDYAGFIVLVIAASALILFTSLGGSQFAWFSSSSVILAVVGVAGTVVFLLVERRAAEPIIAPRLFRNKVFSSASAVGFVVGFAMYGGMTFLPLFMQTVKGDSPTISGLRLLPMMAGLFTASIVSGLLLSRGWRYKLFPIFGTLMICLGFILLGTVGMSTSSVLMGIYMTIFGIGIGAVTQILTTAVQNAVEHRDLGAGTAGANFFRSIGGSFGTAVFGAIYANTLPHKIAANLSSVGVHDTHLNPSILTPDAMRHLPAPVLSALLHAIASSIQTIYYWSLPVGILAVILSFTLPEISLRSRVVSPEDAPVLPDIPG